MNRGLLALCFVLLRLVPVSRGDVFFELDGFNGFYGSPGVPPVAMSKLSEFQKGKAELKCVAFTPDGDWVILFGGNGVWTSNTDLPAIKKLSSLWSDPHAGFKCAAFAPTGGWTILWGQNGSWTEGEIPDGAFKRIVSVSNSGGTLRSVAFGPNGGWVLLYDKTGVAHGGIPKDLEKVLGDCVQSHTTVRCVSFSPEGDWICLTDNGWWTSNIDSPAAKFIDANLKRGYSPKWLAFFTEDTGKGPYRLETKPSQHIVATLTTDIAHPDAKVDEWYVYAPEVPSLPSQVNVKTTFDPAGVVVKDASPLARPVILSRITDGRKELHTVLTIDATLVSRHLRPLLKGEAAPAIADLGWESVRDFTAATPTLNYNTSTFQNWMNSAGLRRKGDESDMEYAHRAFSYVKHHYGYQWPTPVHTGSETCVSAKSDCGGLSSLFASLMRANGIPARLLGGRWADSQKGSDAKYHVKSEFFAKGVGWVPVDSSGAVTDTSGSEYACFGQDAGDFVAMTTAEDLKLDSFIFGQQNLPFFQEIVYWWRGSGKDANSRYSDNWIVLRK